MKNCRVYLIDGEVMKIFCYITKQDGPQGTQPFEEHSGDMESDPMPTSWPKPPDVSTETREMEDIQNE